MTVHFHVTANATSDTYTAYVIMPNAKQYKKEDFQFRGDGDKLDSIIAFTNNGRGEIKLTNVKITYAKLPVEEVKQPTAPKPALGWDSDSKQFTLNFTKATDEPGDAILIGDKSTAWGGNDTAVVKVGDKTNAVVTAYATTLNDVVKSVAAAKSIYELVVDDIVTNVGSYDKETVGADRIAAANKVISHGGFYYTGAGNNVADEVTKKIVNIDVTDSDLTATIVDTYKNLGLGFVLGTDNTIYFGTTDERTVDADGKNGTFEMLKITLTDGKVTDQSEVTLSAADGTVITLDAVNIEFIETLIEEAEANGADAEADFIPEL